MRLIYGRKTFALQNVAEVGVLFVRQVHERKLCSLRLVVGNALAFSVLRSQNEVEGSCCQDADDVATAAC